MILNTILLVDLLVNSPVTVVLFQTLANVQRLYRVSILRLNMFDSSRRRRVTKGRLYDELKSCFFKKLFHYS